MVKQTKVFLLAVAFFSILTYGVLWGGINSAKAFSVYESGSAVIRSDWQIYIDGTRIDNPWEKLTIRTNKPIIFGYTATDVKINLLFSQGTTTQSIVKNTDANGYWICPIEEEILSGDYTLSYSLTDSAGVTTVPEIAATFYVPETLPNKQFIQSMVSIPSTSLNQLNYLTGSIIIFVVIVMLALIYILIKYIFSHE